MFNCSKCGKCCQHVADVKQLKSVDGVCVNYNPSTKLCNIYEDRPAICRVDDGYSTYFKDKVGYEEYIKMNYDACKNLMEKYKDAE